MHFCTEYCKPCAVSYKTPRSINRDLGSWDGNVGINSSWMTADWMIAANALRPRQREAETHRRAVKDTDGIALKTD